MKIREVVEAILAYHPSLGEREAETVDTFKCGDIEAECTGIVTTIAPTVDVIRKTAELGYNLIIPHEPTFYGHLDKTDWLENNKVYKDKIALLNKHGIAVWRDHDHIHAHDPDGIFLGVTKVLGWDDYLQKKEKVRGEPTVYKMPKTTVRKLAEEVKAKMGLNMVRVIGNMDAEVETVAVCGHAYPPLPENQFTDFFELKNIDVLIPGELIDWSVSSYARDAAELGYHKAILAVGHFNMEAPGMEYAPTWLSEVVGGKVPVKYISADDMYKYL